MIDFRYHLVSLVSVFLALAVGIVLGAGPLKGTIGDTLSSQVDQLRAEKATLRTELDTAQTAVENRDTFARAVLPTLVGNKLGGESVILITLPGSATAAVKPLTESLTAAGARVTGRIEVKDAWTDPADAVERDDVLRSLGAASSTTVPASGAARSVSSAAAGAPAVATSSPLPTPVPPTPVPPTPVPTVSGATNAGTALTHLLARAVVTRDLGQTGPLDAEGRRLLDGLRKSGLIGVNGDLSGRGTQVVVLAPGVQPISGNEPSEAASGEGDPLAQWAAIAVGLDTYSDGVVVVGPASSALAGGVLAALRAQDTLAGTVSTVDSGGTPMGDVATVLALREQSLGGAGSYGSVGKVRAPLPALTEVHQ